MKHSLILEQKYVVTHVLVAALFATSFDPSDHLIDFLKTFSIQLDLSNSDQSLRVNSKYNKKKQEVYNLNHPQMENYKTQNSERLNPILWKKPSTSVESKIKLFKKQYIKISEVFEKVKPFEKLNNLFVVLKQWCSSVKKPKTAVYAFDYTVCYKKERYIGAKRDEQVSLQWGYLRLEIISPCLTFAQQKHCFINIFNCY